MVLVLFCVLLYSFMPLYAAAPSFMDNTTYDNPALMAAIHQDIKPFLQPGDKVDITILNPRLASTLTGNWVYRSTLQQLWSPHFVMVGQQGNRQVGIPVKVQVTRRVWAARTSIAAGQALSVSSLEPVECVVPSGTQWVPANQPIDAYIANLPIAKGQPIDIKKLHLKQDIQAHQPITVDMESDDVTISVMAIADTPGVKGQIIPVTAGKKRYQAEITGPSRAKVRI